MFECYRSARPLHAIYQANVANRVYNEDVDEHDDQVKVEVALGEVERIDHLESCV